VPLDGVHVFRRFDLCLCDGPFTAIATRERRGLPHDPREHVFKLAQNRFIVALLELLLLQQQFDGTVVALSTLELRIRCYHIVAQLVV
jgi:hypothetical protein